MTTSVVTGGAGFLGPHLCEFLLSEGRPAICLDDLHTSTFQTSEHFRDDASAFHAVDVGARAYLRARI
jgi:dTDP-glucose 4,6-dehydratase